MWKLFEHICMSVVRNLIYLYLNCDYTQPVWEQISNTNQFIQNAQLTFGRAVPTYPLRVYSEILMFRIARGQRSGDRSHPLVVVDHNNRRSKTHCVIMRASVCKHTVACGCKLVHAVSGSY